MKFFLIALLPPAPLWVSAQTRDLDDRIESLPGRMTLGEKVGQLTWFAASLRYLCRAAGFLAMNCQAQASQSNG